MKLFASSSQSLAKVGIGLFALIALLFSIFCATKRGFVHSVGATGVFMAWAPFMVRY